MKKHLYSIIVGLGLSSVPVIAQQAVQPCITYHAMEEHFKADTQAKTRYEAAQKQLEQETIQNSMSNARPVAFQYTVPVVFHVLHQGGAENISDATITAALAQINSDYARAGSDVTSIAQPFQNLYINSDIKFMLAHKDPNGNCTTGIEHLYDTRTVWQQANTSYYNGITWNPTKYLNVIIVSQIVPSGTVAGGGTIVGYTYKPGTWSTGASQDAIVYNFGYLNSLYNMRSLSHEIGHWLNLSHTFGNTNNPGVACGDDQLYDTPPTKGNYGSCGSSSSGNSCAASSTSVYTAGQQNVENIMDYSSCPKNFTTDQTNAMRTALASSVNNRQNLWSATNLTATDVNGTSPCAPIADFYAANSALTSYTVCEGGSITFKDFSYNGTISSYNWSAGGGANIASPSASVTSITFPTAGATTVALTVGNSTGSNTKVRNVYVMNAVPGITGPTNESFENQGVPSGWSVINPNSNSAAWDQTFDVVCYDGFGAFFIEGSKCATGQIDYLETPIIDVANNQDQSFSFALSYAQKSSTQNDVLKVQGSKDCGGTWNEIASLSASFMQLNTGGVTTNSYVPGSQFEWKVVDVSAYPQWNQYKTSSSVKLRFVFTEGGTGQGNNLYIDAVNLFNTSTGINELVNQHSFKLFPNPANGETRVSFKLNDAAVVKVDVLDMLGRQVLNVNNASLNPGEHAYTINSNGELQRGVYFVNVSVNGATMSHKLIIN